MKHFRYAKTAGLTLLELRVVIGVAALLAPVVQTARASSGATSGHNNLKQLGAGLANFESASGK